MQNVLKDYEPVVSPTGDVIGMIEVSVRLNAMEQIHETLMQVQVGETGYVWALGGQGRDRGVYIVSKDGARDGENIYNATDADGEHFVRKIVNTALEKGSSPGAVSFMTYQWKNPGDEHPRTKLSAYVYFAPWDWIIGAGVYMDDYHDARRDMHKAMTGYTGKIITSSAVILVLMVGLAFFLGRRMADPIGRMVAIAQDVAGCDVDAAGRRLDELATRRPSLARAADSEEASAKVDETGQLFAAMQSMISNLDSLVGQVQRSGVQVTTSSTEIAASARQMESTMEHHRENTAEISSAANEISATSRELLQTVQAVLESTNQTADLAAKGRQSLNQMASIMGELSGSTDSISGKLSDLFDKANDVVSIISTITKVADQTNLLSLNASIEAEKAGDYGLGFAVVAREIRRLADQTGVAALDIEKKVNEMLEAVKEGASEMERFTSDVKNGAEKTHKIGGSLEEIMQRVQDLQPQLEDVNDGVRVQSEGADQISNNMLELSDAAKHTAEAVKEFNRAATQLNQAVQALQAEVNRFKVSE
jgi:methyl-accepting chemotaxis protein WspA